MPANVGEMFYTGDVPWRGEGVHLASPATVEQALKVGGLDWSVGEVDLMTADNPPSPVIKRKALVRTDRPAGHPGRVLGVAHRGFKPVQNRDGALLFDAIFGQGKPVYHTGGYLGQGEVVWLMAKINRPVMIGDEDEVAPYALFANSHDGSMAFNIRLTTIRVVCQNTLSLAMRETQFGEQFRRGHSGSLRDHAAAAQQFFSATLREIDEVTKSFTSLAEKQCNDSSFTSLLDSLMPEPKAPRNADANPGLKKAWEKKVEDIRAARQKIQQLRTSGKGMQLKSAAGTYWGALNAILEYVDHFKKTKDGQELSYALLGDGADLKTKAFKVIQEMAKAAV